jgi:6-phosphogluconolactonase
VKLEVFPDETKVAEEAARFIAAEAQRVVAARGRFLLAVSGGRTPWLMLRALARENVPWKEVHVFQVDERVAPTGHPDRNFTHIRETLLNRAPIPANQVHALPVEAADLAASASWYAGILQQIAGSPPVLDLVHLGLGPDGHTASLVPGDPVLAVADADVAVTGAYQGRTRMTLTYPILNRARNILWVVTGTEKAGMLARLRAGDPGIPAGRVSSAQAIIFADKAAADRGPAGTEA